jgi:exopolysaccharide production protein ExoZ
VFFMFRLAVFKPALWLTAPVSRTEEPLGAYVGRSLLFLPSEKFPILGVGWTLNFEMYFYIVFALALWINRRLAPLIVVAFLIAVFYSDGTVCSLFVCHYYSHDYIHYFVAGVAVYYVWEFGSPLARGWPVAAMCAAGLLYFFGSQFARPLWPDWSLALWLFPPFVVACSLFMKSSGAPITWKPMVLLGDASYSLYLTHTIFFYGVERHLLHPWHLPTPKESRGDVV